MPDELRLEVTDYTDLTRWRWVLTDADGAFLAGHEVRLDPGAERFEAFTALRHYVDWHAAPDKRLAEEARIVTGLGDWIGTEVFGPAIGAALLEHRPATVQVVLPPGAEALAYLPLEAARFQGRSLAGHGLTLVIRPPAADGSPAKAHRADGSLRVLGLFSLPEGGTALNLRRERQSLVQLINGIAATGRAADVKALQYGVTRARLRAILDDGEGWDIIHISGHGTPGELILETADGRPDRIPAADLADLLDLARERVKLVTVSACWSAALATAEPRRLLGLPAPEDQRHFDPKRIAASPPAPAVSGDIATTLAIRLGCAVLAMRFPVGDEFAIELAAKLYPLLVDEGRPLPDAVAMTLKHLADRPVGEWFPALSMAAPAIFGATASRLALTAPERTAPVSDAAEHPKMEGFPPQPDRFVGRTGVMTRASAALAAESGVPGVLLHGMPGGGKTACALELAHTHENAFDKLIWFKAPDEGAAIDDSLTSLALTLEQNLPGLQIIDKVVTEEALTAFLPKLTELMKRNRLLLVIDNAESLLTDTGQWRDERWGQVIGALTDHSGCGRVIVTSRRVLAETLPVQVASVDALTLDEGLLLARELPNLRRLMLGTLDGTGTNTARRLAADVVKIAQGHPKLLELADGQAANPDRLTELLRAGTQAWLQHGGAPDGFFATGETTASPSDYLSVLTAWTNTVTDTLSPAERDLFWFLCCLEEPDRIPPVLIGNWANLWQRLDRRGNPPALGLALAAVVAGGLAAIRQANDSEHESYGVHPSVAVAGRDRAGDGFQDAVDTEVGAFWANVCRHASGEAWNGPVHTGLLIRAGLAAVPYLTRQQELEAAATLLNNAFIRDLSRATAAAMLPAIQHITRHHPHLGYILGYVWEVLDPAAAETHLRTFIGEASAGHDYKAASLAAGLLITLCQNSGRLDEALVHVWRKARYTQQAGLGRWTQLADEVQRLQVLNDMGRSSQVFNDVQGLLSLMGTLPVSPGSDDLIPPWHVREVLLGTGCDAAIQLGRWQEALDLNGAMAASMLDRRAPSDIVARTMANDYGPLLGLDRANDALALLRTCRKVLDETGDFEGLGKVFSALATVENERGHGAAAIRLQHDALRYSYLAPDVAGIAVRYHNLGNYNNLARQPVRALASHLTAALIRTSTGIGCSSPQGANSSVHHAAIDLTEFGAAAEPPANVADLCRRIGDIPGTDPAGLIARLSPDPETAERTLQDLITEAQKLASPKRRFWGRPRRR